jgi:hypothetical protein
VSGTGVRTLAAGRRGQAAVELVAILPLVAALGLAVLQLLAAGLAAELAGHAAEAGAVALLERQDPAEAARASVPGWSRPGLRVEVARRRVEVHLRPPALVPALARALEAEAVADAGPEPAS